MATSALFGITSALDSKVSFQSCEIDTLKQENERLKVAIRLLVEYQTKNMNVRSEGLKSEMRDSIGALIT